MTTSTSDPESTKVKGKKRRTTLTTSTEEGPFATANNTSIGQKTKNMCKETNIFFGIEKNNHSPTGNRLNIKPRARCDGVDAPKAPIRNERLAQLTETGLARQKSREAMNECIE